MAYIPTNAECTTKPPQTHLFVFLIISEIEGFAPECKHTRCFPSLRLPSAATLLASSIPVNPWKLNSSASLLLRISQPGHNRRAPALSTMTKRAEPPTVEYQERQRCPARILTHAVRTTQCDPAETPERWRLRLTGSCPWAVPHTRRASWGSLRRPARPVRSESGRS